ncbi:hypothetical protein CDAR_437461 [Caerostris darwini]|uniref:Uncharacterized protein n=1 Tax=Caerostris darwini TaxID=1538125 RepID=A0AAV4NST4_9ARAC|nr:hypothetical protein CDAR_437461 [Caerostris darwini]
MDHLPVWRNCFPPPPNYHPRPQGTRYSVANCCNGAVRWAIELKDHEGKTFLGPLQFRPRKPNHLKRTRVRGSVANVVKRALRWDVSLINDSLFQFSALITGFRLFA